MADCPEIGDHPAGEEKFAEALEARGQRTLESFISRCLKSAFFMCQRMIERRLKQGGVIINIGSIEAIMPFAEDLVPYNVSKAGVIALTRALAKEYGKRAFRINVIVPGGIVTPGTKAVAKGITQFKLGLLKTGVQFIGIIEGVAETTASLLKLVSGL